MKKIAMLAVALAVGGATPALAHHSSNLYFDDSKEFTFTGALDEVRMVNPHVQITIWRKNAKGKPEVWSVETHNPGALRRMGWRPALFHPGEPVTVVGNPARNGDHYAQLVTMTFADGYVLSPQRLNPPRPAPKS